MYTAGAQQTRVWTEWGELRGGSTTTRVQHNDFLHFLCFQPLSLLPAFGWFFPRTFLSHMHPADMSPQKSKLQATPFSLPPGHWAATAERSGEAAHVITPKPKKEMRVPPGVPPTHGKQERRQSDFRKMRRSSNFRVHSSCLGAWPHPLGLSLHHQGRGDIRNEAFASRLPPSCQLRCGRAPAAPGPSRSWVEATCGRRQTSKSPGAWVPGTGPCASLDCLAPVFGRT